MAYSDADLYMVYIVSSYLNSHNLYNTFQSTYHPGHSTEAAHIKVVNDLFLSPSKGNMFVTSLA